MPIETRVIQIKEKSIHEENSRPTIIWWKDEKIIRNQAIGAAIHEILQAVSVEGSQDVVQINVIGDPSSGKTTLAKTIAHMIHSRSKIPFSVRIFQREDYLNFKETLKLLKPANYVLLFDDLSFLGADATSKQIEMVKQAVTEIRHLPGGQDVKIVIIKNFHYTLGLPKYLRGNDFSLFTSVGSNEDENMEKIVGSRFMNRVRSFQKIRNKIKIAPEGQKKFTYQLGTKGQWTYSYKKPFIPVLYWNGDTLRHIISPRREWIDQICVVCDEFAANKKIESDVDIQKFIQNSAEVYGTSTLKAAVLIKLHDNGFDAFRPEVVSCGRFLDKALATGKVSLKEMGAYYKAQQTITKMKKDVEGILENSKTLEPPKETEKQ